MASWIFFTWFKFQNHAVDLQKLNYKNILSWLNHFSTLYSYIDFFLAYDSLAQPFPTEVISHECFSSGCLKKSNKDSLFN